MHRSVARANIQQPAKFPRPALQNCMTIGYSEHFHKEEKDLLKYIHINTSTGLWDKIDSHTLKCSVSVSALLHLCEFRLNRQQRNKEESVALV